MRLYTTCAAWARPKLIEQTSTGTAEFLNTAVLMFEVEELGCNTRALRWIMTWTSRVGREAQHYCDSNGPLIDLSPDKNKKPGGENSRKRKEASSWSVSAPKSNQPVLQT